MPNDLEVQVQMLEKQMKKLQANQQNDQLSIVVFSGDLDKVLAAMIIATGARAMDMEVKLFFTFWGTTMLRDKKKKAKGKDFISKMFGCMLPKGSKQLKLSQMHMAGMGTAMIRDLMKKKNVASLEEMIATAAELGVEINICQMSMDLMGFKKEEMIDYPNLKYVGVGSYLADAGESRVQLFI
ncbi:MAG TPA: DsrE/DsrF/DrsH-like family protein [Bacteroidales bacterium]|nr:DsrE/DsrF/DrsH-like family protein [Bacteroidales bacterium]